LVTANVIPIRAQNSEIKICNYRRPETKLTLYSKFRKVDGIENMEHIYSAEESPELYRLNFVLFGNQVD
jgi:hypothetical protein